MSEDLTILYVTRNGVQKFQVGRKVVIKLIVYAFSSFDFAVDITDDAEGIYKGTNLVAVAMDEIFQDYAIAFGICKGETAPCWSWWMSVLKECIGDNPNLLFISDRHATIALVVEKEFPLAFHDVC
ncbi:transposase, MuDR, MULE transposase domain protein [Tanacetum coccineum]